MERGAVRLSETRGIRVEYLPETTSTNDVARNSTYAHGDIVVAGRQTAGRGQRGNRWSSRSGENLTFSIVLQPGFLPAERQFLLSETVSLAVTDLLAGYGIAAAVKWPNDIYIGERKVAGILIENDISGTAVTRSVAGIGLNVNQLEFPPDLPNPVSMHAAAGRPFDLTGVLDAFIDTLHKRYALLEEGRTALLDDDYRARLYRLDREAAYRLPDGTCLRGTVRGVGPLGQLMLEHPDGSVRPYLFKEIEFIL